MHHLTGTIFIPTTLNSTQEIAAYVDDFEPNPPDNAILVELLALYPDVPALGS